MDAIERQDQSLTTVGLAVGFQSSTTFQRQFKKHAHMRPREFRKTVLEQLGGTASLPVQFSLVACNSGTYRKNHDSWRKNHEI
jgi:AraC-like DNA-binding protein